MKALNEFTINEAKFTPEPADIKGWEVLDLPNSPTKLKKMKKHNAKLLKDYIDVKKFQAYMDKNKDDFAPLAKAEDNLSFANLHTEPTVLIATGDGYAVFNKDADFEEYQAKSFYSQPFKYKEA
tara:strand:+ start:258 stop:629 length:372 start_codon:yes stop_codon:yes gene_type:complete